MPETKRCLQTVALAASGAACSAGASAAKPANRQEARSVTVTDDITVLIVSIAETESCRQKLIEMCRLKFADFWRITDKERHLFERHTQILVCWCVLVSAGVYCCVLVRDDMCCCVLVCTGVCWCALVCWCLLVWLVCIGV